MGQTLYLDCFAGISGDMTVGCLLDLGASLEKLKEALESLSLEGYQIVVSRVNKAGLDLCDFAVCLDEEHENHDHDMEYLHGEISGEERHSHHHTHTDTQEYSHAHKDTQEHTHVHTDAQEASHGQWHTQEHAHTHHHRGLAEINEMIVQAKLSDNAKKTALRIFDIIGEAEAKAHGVEKNQVHFHEVGAVDSIVDIVAAAVCLDDLNITEVIVPRLCEGKGMVRCQHGMMPIPVPAVANMVQTHCLTIEATEIEGELVTPTGAAIVAAVRTAESLPKHYRILRTGMGAGKRSYSRPSILRGMLIQAVDEAKEEQIWKLETNLDDCTGEALGCVMEQLFKQGARDVCYIPAFMKKNRPSYLLQVICTEDKTALCEKVIFENTTTIGIRKYPVERAVLPRRTETFDTAYGAVEVKVCTLPDGTKRVYPEYESMHRICTEQKLSYWEVYQEVTGCLRQF